MTRRPTQRTRTAKPSLEAQLAALRALDTSADGALDQLRAALRSSTGILVAAAAKRVGEDRLDALVEELAPAFERLLDDPAKRDPGCRGKIAIVNALHTLDYWEDRVFARGLRHVQPEGWGAEDTAAHLRGLCGIAHAQLGRDDALAVLARLLADPERATRTAAARGIADAGRPDAAALIRYKLLVGDDDGEVLAACVEALLHLARDASYDFLVELLAEDDERAQAVALGLGGARITRALEPLVAWSAGCRPEPRQRVAYLAIALLRTDAATAFLLDAVRERGRADAVAAARALATFKDDAAVCDALRAAAREHPETAVGAEVDVLLGR